MRAIRTATLAKAGETGSALLAPAIGSASSRLFRHGRVLVSYAVLAILIVVYASMSPGVLTTAELNIQVTTAFALVLVATGQTIVMLTGGIDLSVGGVVSVATCIAATKFGPEVGSQVGWAAVIVAAGALAGVINGVLIVYVRLEPFVVTLATWSVYAGIALLILSQAGGSVPQGYLDTLTGTVLGLGVPVLLLLTLVGLWLWFRATRIGTRLKAVGSNSEGAFLSGVSPRRTTLLAYGISGAFAALGGLFLITQTGSGDPLAGNEFVLTSVAAAVIGGTSLAGGSGDVLGTIAGAITISLLGSVVFVLQLPAYWQPVASGILLVLAALGGSVLDRRQQRQRL